MIARPHSPTIIIYNTVDGKAFVSLYAKDGTVWMNQNQIAELFDTSVPNISMHIPNILKDEEIEPVGGTRWTNIPKTHTYWTMHDPTFFKGEIGW